MPSLTRAEALARAELLTVRSMEVDLDLDRGPELFGSRTVIRFACRAPGASTFVELSPRVLHRAVLNGRALDQAALADGRLTVTGLAAENVLEVEATMAYRRDGQGLHRSTDPADDEDYVYGHLFLDAAPTVFACLDQPDLKAPYTVRVAAPAGWTVLGNGAATEIAPGRWQHASTPPLATYFVTVCAGPWASVRARHDGIPLGIHVRRSLGPHLERQAAQMLATTTTCLDYYQRLFGIRYPFGEYHQVFVPEFNAGAMENPGCVTLRDQYVYRGATTPEQIALRDNTIAHEMAHMWFGDLVTMRWWDDLWLNESFAEYLASRALVETGVNPGAWVDFGMLRKLWGYAADRAPSTHPVAGSPEPDAISALGNFDGISYAKGASILRQLITHLGDDAFLAGVRNHLRENEFGNADLAGFLAATSAAAGRSLDAWAEAWLRTAGADRLALAADGTLVRTEPDAAPVGPPDAAPVNRPDAAPVGRPHTLDVAAFAGGAETVREVVVLEGGSVLLPALRGLPADAVRVPNAADLTWAEVDLDPMTLAVLPGSLDTVPDASARAVVWVSLLGGVSRGLVDPRLVVDVFTSAWPHETNAAVLARVSSLMADTVVPLFLSLPEQEPATARLSAAADVLADRAVTSAPDAEALAVAAARAWARTGTDVDRLRRWAAGVGIPALLEGDDDFRWLVLRRLAALGAVRDHEIEAAEAADRSLAGRLAALGVRAVRPTREAKEWAWARLREDAALSNYEALQIARGFWVAPDPALVRPYVPMVGDLVVAMSARMSDDALSRIVTEIHPTPVVEEATTGASAAVLARTDLTPGVRRAWLDAGHVLGEALASRHRFG
jgi:aminopeptidase N